MTGPVVVPPGGGEVVGDAADRRVEILSDLDALHATWSRFGPRRPGADLHVHREHTDLFYVLEGELTVMLGPDGEEVTVPAGALARVPPLVVHGFRNGSDAEVRYLNFHAPGKRFAEFMRALRDGRPFRYDQHPPPADGGRPVAEAAIGGGEVVVDEPGRRVVRLADAEAIAVAEVAIEPGAGDAEERVDRRHTESLYVLAGELAVTAGAARLTAGPGTWVQLPPGTPHALDAGGAGHARYLELRTPSP